MANLLQVHSRTSLSSQPHGQGFAAATSRNDEGRQIVPLMRAMTIGRINGTICLPSSFLLVAAANPCPCGWLDSDVRECTCSKFAIERYRSRLSGPLLDRIDLQVLVETVSLKVLRQEKAGESSAVVRDRVLLARERQRARFADTPIRT